MRFKLKIKRNDSEADSSEKEFEQEVVRIGRLPENDVPLNDSFVSRHQAEIRALGEKFIIVATTKSSFIYLNDVQLLNNQESVITDGDEIRLPGFSISFLICHDRGEEVKGIEKEEDFIKPAPIHDEKPHIPLHEVERAGKALALTMRKAFSQALSKGRAERKERLRGVVDEFLSPFRGTGAYENILASASAAFSGEKFEPIDTQKKKRDSAVAEAFAALAGDWGLKNILSSEKETLEFSAKIKSVMDIFTKNLFENISMYREFQQEYDVEATRIYNWEKNPLKHAVSEESIREYLFKQVRGGPKNVMENLEEVHRDIKLHQLGVLKGFKKSLKELLNEMSPATLASETGIGETDKNYKKIFEKLWTKDHTVLWKRYVEKYTDLCENETKTFNSIQKKFQTGYLTFLKNSKEK